GAPIKLVGTGEKLDALDNFDPERIAGRILGMGDIVGLVERAAETIDKAEADVTLPKGAKILGTKAYTGYQGAYGQDFTSGENSNIALFYTPTQVVAGDVPKDGCSASADWWRRAV
ncbi:MAG: hypothetical protein B7Z81_15845, partial [Acidocella sp. 20-61-6]